MPQESPLGSMIHSFHFYLHWLEPHHSPKYCMRRGIQGDRQAGRQATTPPSPSWICCLPPVCITYLTLSPHLRWDSQILIYYLMRLKQRRKSGIPPLSLLSYEYGHPKKSRYIPQQNNLHISAQMGKPCQETCNALSE